MNIEGTDPATLLNTKTSGGRIPYKEHCTVLGQAAGILPAAPEDHQTGAKRKTMASRFGAQAAVNEPRDRDRPQDEFQKQYRQRKKQQKALEVQPEVPKGLIRCNRAVVTSEDMGDGRILEQI